MFHEQSHILKDVQAYLHLLNRLLLRFQHSGLFIAARNTLRPILPNPLIPTFTVILISSFSDVRIIIFIKGIYPCNNSFAAPSSVIKIVDVGACFI